MKTVDEIIQEKQWSELTAEERTHIAELADNEIAFNEMKQFFLGIDQLVIDERYEPSADVKSSLDQIFQAKHPGLVQTWEATPAVKVIPLYNKTWFRVAAILVICVGTLPFIWNTTETSEFKASTPVAQETNIEESSIQDKKIATKQEETTTSTKQKPLLAANNLTSGPKYIERKVQAKSSDDEGYMETMSAADTKSEVIYMSSSPSTFSVGMDKDLNPFQEDKLNSKTRSQPIETEAYLDLIVASY